MKKIKFFAAMFAVLALAVACNPIENDPTKPDGNKPKPDAGPGSEAQPYTVAEAIKEVNKEAWVKGKIIGFMIPGDNIAQFDANTDTVEQNIIIADTNEERVKIMPVQLLPGDIRNALNLAVNKENLGKEVVLYGTLTNYFDKPGLKGVSFARFEGKEFGNKPASPEDIIFTQSFKKAFGNFETINILGDAEWMIDSYGYAKITGYDGQNKNANEDWLVSPKITIPANTTCKLNISYVTRYFTNIQDEAVVMYSEDYKGDVKTATWVNIETTFANADDWKPFHIFETDMSKLGGKEITLALKYLATDGNAGTWEVESISILKGEVEKENVIMYESLMRQESFDKFTAYSVKGTAVWTFDSRYGAKISGYDGAAKVTAENEDWFISPALNLEGKEKVILDFKHSRGPANNINVGTIEGWYKVLVSNDYKEGDPTLATWVELTGVNNDIVNAWKYVPSGEIEIPAAQLKANARIAFKYVCSNEASATWEIKDIRVK